MAHLQLSQLVSAPRYEVFDYVCDPQNLPFLLQANVDVKVLSEGVELKRGTEIHFQMARFGLSQSVRFCLEDVLRGTRLTYRQVEGLFGVWTHTIKFDEQDNKTTLVTDIINYQVPLGVLGHLADDLIVRSDMRRILADRLTRVADHFAS